MRVAVVVCGSLEAVAGEPVGQLAGVGANFPGAYAEVCLDWQSC